MKLANSSLTRVGHVERMGDETIGKESRCPKYGGEKQAKKTKIAMERYIKRH